MVQFVDQVVVKGDVQVVVQVVVVQVVVQYFCSDLSESCGTICCLC